MLDTNDARGAVRLRFVVYHDVAFDAWVARCLNTGHSSLAKEKELALRCLTMTVEASLSAHVRTGKSVETWARRYALKPGESVPGTEHYDEARAERRVLGPGAEALVCG